MARPRTNVPLGLLRSAPRTSPLVAASARRTLATVQDAPKPAAPARKTTHGGLSDQDRIFSNLQMRGDHGLKGAMVSYFPHFIPTPLDRLLRCTGRLGDSLRGAGRLRRAGGGVVDSLAFDWQESSIGHTVAPALHPSLPLAPRSSFRSTPTAGTPQSRHRICIELNPAPPIPAPIDSTPSPPYRAAHRTPY